MKAAFTSASEAASSARMIPGVSRALITSQRTSHPRKTLPSGLRLFWQVRRISCYFSIPNRLEPVSDFREHARFNLRRFRLDVRRSKFLVLRVEKILSNNRKFQVLLLVLDDMPGDARISHHIAWNAATGRSVNEPHSRRQRIHISESGVELDVV